jgi:hypothetical protein
MAHLGNPGEELRCPICGRGVLADIAYDETPGQSSALEQQPDSRQLDRYTCGHEVLGAELASADRTLDVEQRHSEETATPLPDETEG